MWAARENWLALKKTIHEEIKDRFDEEEIEIPFPHRTRYTGAVTEPFPPSGLQTIHRAVDRWAAT